MPREKHLPKEAPKGGGRAFFVSPKTMELIKKFLGRTDVELDPKQFEMEEKAGVRHYRLKEKQETEGRGGGGSSAVCYFGEEVENAGESGTEAGVRGGTLIAGDQTWNVLPYPFDLSADGEFLIWIEVGVTCNSEDDLPLPGLLTSTEPTWETGTLAGGYPDTIQPDGTTPTGTAIIAIGTLTVTDGLPSWEPAGCGNITLGYCPTNISITRG